MFFSRSLLRYGERAKLDQGQSDVTILRVIKILWKKYYDRYTTDGLSKVSSNVSKIIIVRVTLRSVVSQMRRKNVVITSSGT